MIKKSIFDILGYKIIHYNDELTKNLNNCWIILVEAKNDYGNYYLFNYDVILGKNTYLGESHWNIEGARKEYSVSFELKSNSRIAGKEIKIKDMDGTPKSSDKSNKRYDQKTIDGYRYFMMGNYESENHKGLCFICMTRNQAEKIINIIKKNINKN